MNIFNILLYVFLPLCLCRRMKARAPPPPQVPQPAPRHIFRNTVPDGGGTSDTDAKENVLRTTVELQLTLPQGYQTSVTEDGRLEHTGTHMLWMHHTLSLEFTLHLVVKCVLTTFFVHDYKMSVHPYLHYVFLRTLLFSLLPGFIV